MPKALKNMIKFKLIFVLSCLFIFNQAHAWFSIAPGIEYQDIYTNSTINLTNAHIHAFKISLKYNKFNLAFASDLKNKPAFVNNFAKQYAAILAINGGFFDKSSKPLGLRITNYKQYNPIKNISWWGIFYIKNNKPQISQVNNFNKNNNISFAVQSGPRLIINGRIPKLKPGYAERTALGITQNNEIIIIVTQNFPITTTELAEFMQNSPLKCANALNLDGGNSSQLVVNLSDFQLNVTGFSEISDAIFITSVPKKATDKVATPRPDIANFIIIGKRSVLSANLVQ